MDSLVKGIIIAILCVAKLIITGICLAIGFKCGYVIWEKMESRKQNKVN